MPTHSETKERIISILKFKGPSIPVRIAKEIENSILFTSAFLSELLSEKRIKISYMRVGSSPIYFIPGQEFQLEKYLDNIKGKEKEALLLLKEKNFLEDSSQEPAIRVALRSIKDFAIPFQKNNKLYWRYFTNPENDFEKKAVQKEELTPHKPEPKKETSSLTEPPRSDLTKSVAKQNIVSEKTQPKQEDIQIFDKKPEPKPVKKKTTKKKTTTKKSSEKKNEKFFNKVKEFLNEKSIEISGIEGFSKNDLTLKIKENGEEKILVAYNKKRLSEADITNAHKKAKEYGLKYTIYSLGEPLKKLTTLIEALQDLDKMEKLE